MYCRQRGVSSEMIYLTISHIARAYYMHDRGCLTTSSIDSLARALRHCIIKCIFQSPPKHGVAGELDIYASLSKYNTVR